MRVEVNIEEENDSQSFSDNSPESNIEEDESPHSVTEPREQTIDEEYTDSPQNYSE